MDSFFFIVPIQDSNSDLDIRSILLYHWANKNFIIKSYYKSNIQEPNIVILLGYWNNDKLNSERKIVFFKFRFINKN